MKIKILVISAVLLVTIVGVALHVTHRSPRPGAVVTNKYKISTAMPVEEYASGLLSLKSIAASLEKTIGEANTAIEEADRTIAEQQGIVQELSDLEKRFDEKRISVEEYLQARQNIGEKLRGGTKKLY